MQICGVTVDISCIGSNTHSVNFCRLLIVDILYTIKPVKLKFYGIIILYFFYNAVKTFALMKKKLYQTRPSVSQKNADDSRVI